jgi:hypothetical protein
VTVYGGDGRQYSDDKKLEWFHETRNHPAKVKCIRDNPPMKGFGRQLKIGDIVEIHGTICDGFGFQVTVPSECAFYDYTAFEPADDFFNK